MEPSIEETQREVWDILNAGHLQRFTANGKLVHNCLLYMDHAGNVYRHGRLELPRDWALTEGKEQVEHLAEQRKKTERIQFTCPNCGFMFSGLNCPHCGMPIVLQGEAKDFLPAVLVEMTQFEYEKAVERKREKAAEPSKQEFYSGFLWIAQERGHSQGWAAHRFREKFDCWPNSLKKEAVYPKAAVWNFDKHCRIRYAKAKEKAEKPPVGVEGEVNAGTLHEEHSSGFRVVPNLQQDDGSSGLGWSIGKVYERAPTSRASEEAGR